ncbi:MAG TPA: hypothetical protein ENN76_03640 [Euryarchaeota archaeon]|nr:hypothetical protein [Euryarchaeota archaeon]
MEKNTGKLIIGVVTVIVIALYVIFVIQPTFTSNDDSYQKPVTEDEDIVYERFYDIGSGVNDWWVNYPLKHETPGVGVSHPDWCTDDVAKAPVIIFVHSDDCAPCVTQKRNLNNLFANYPSTSYKYHPLPATFENERSMEAFEIYDPTGGMPYIPLTVFVTLMEDGDTIKTVWHAREGAMTETELQRYLDDAMMFYEG